MPDPLIDENDAGAPVIRGTRMKVDSVLGRIQHGETLDDLVSDNPDIPRAAFEAAVAYARKHRLVGRPGDRQEPRPESFADVLRREGYEPTGTPLHVMPERVATPLRLWDGSADPESDASRGPRQTQRTAPGEER